ncbi:MAG TPA: hypothetical protein VEB65_06970, partial [Solirubrobacterales bacterium]|nr:hypothetical protein [Solirubrobacterales bacterium]
MLAPLPPNFAATVASLHEVAAELIAPARKPQNEIALEATPGGFGTPYFEFDGARRRVRVEGDELVHECSDKQRRAPLRSLAGAGEAITELLPIDSRLSDEPLSVDAAASRALGAFYAFGAEVLGRLLAEAGPDDEPTPVRLWPEHFDIAIELGSERQGVRANYGLSPGDEGHEEPYLYVGPWSAAVDGGLWNAQGFAGAELAYSELVAAEDQAAAAFDFFASRRDALTA